jgi:hypothetical protein
MPSIAIRLIDRLLVGALALLLAGCGSLPFLSQPTPTPSPTFTPLPTDTPLPSPTFTLEPTATFTPPPSPTLPPTVEQPTLPPAEPTIAPTVDPDQAIRVFYINKEEAGPWGCGEALWYINTKQAKSSVVENDIRFALNTILTYHGETIGQLYNPGYASTIGVNSVSFDGGGTVVVNLTGTWTATKDRCDGRRFIDQLRMTIKQFDGISGIVIYLNGTPISDALSRK